MLEIKKFANGFEYIEIINKSASAKIALQGAHIFEYTSELKKEMLWLSPTSDFEYGRAIRGGIPICWPRFGVEDKSMPSHGFSRTALFELVSVEELDEWRTKVIMRLRDTKESRSIWDYKFELDVAFVISESLSVELITKNRDTKEFMITQALHTYFSVSNIDDVLIKGLENTRYIDTLTDETLVQEASIKIKEETDRVYLDVNSEIILEDKLKKISLNTVGSNSTVVWNPWIAKGARMSGMRAEAYKEFVCIESANAFDDFRLIKAGDSHRLRLVLN
ncbi:MAG: D-hexose-6-phosphate mutarotase [Sulfurimonas sp.]|nr:D-hexose-6-phosphate mutarotase [Sulfurimonas sp.]